MNCQANDCDVLLADESMVSSNCNHLLHLQRAGNLVLFHVVQNRRILLQNFVSGWSTKTIANTGVPRLSLFYQVSQSGLFLQESPFDADDSGDHLLLWSVVVDSISGGLTFSLGDEGGLQLYNDDGIIWQILPAVMPNK